MFIFYIEHDKELPMLDKIRSIVSRFSVFVVYKSAVSTVQKSNYRNTPN